MERSKYGGSQAHTVIPALKLKQEDYKFDEVEANLRYLERPCLKKGRSLAAPACYFSCH